MKLRPNWALDEPGTILLSWSKGLGQEKMKQRIYKMIVASVYPFYPDKLVDELAKGRLMEKILRAA